MECPILAAFVFPHPPIIIPAIGRGEETAIASTTNACKQAARRIASLHPDAIILTSPHAPLCPDYFHISPGHHASGSFAPFRAPNETYTVPYDPPLAHAIASEARTIGLLAGPLGEHPPTLDHGTLVPLHFLRQSLPPTPIVRIGLSTLPPIDHYRFGQSIARAAAKLHRRIVFLASGDLSHRLTPNGPYGFAPEGPAFDRLLTTALAHADFPALLSIPPTLAHAAGECGLRSFQIMAGALDALDLQPQLLSYEGPFGVGYAVASFLVTAPNPARHFPQTPTHPQTPTPPPSPRESPLVRLARLSLETYIQTHRYPSLPHDLPPKAAQPAAAFVSLKKNGELRGCIGTILPTTPSLAQEILRNAVAAGTQDPRFPPVSPEELPLLTYSVDVLSTPEPVDSIASLDPKRYGIIVTSNGRRGLLLPDLEGVHTVEQQIQIARQKASIPAHAPLSLERFQVTRYH